MSQRYRIVNSFRFFLKSVSVIPRLDFREKLFTWHIQLLTGKINTVGKVSFEFLLSIAEHRGVITVHRDVCQVVEIGEQRDVAELADPGDKHETFLIFKRFDDGIESLQIVQNVLGMRLSKIIQDRLVIFIKKNHNLFFFRELTNQIPEHLIRFIIRERNLVILPGFLKQAA